MTMTDYSQHHADQAGKTNAVVGAIMAIAVASFIGAFWQAIQPIESVVATPISPFYRIAMLSILCGIAGASYVFIRTGGSDPASQHRIWYVAFRRRLMRKDALLPDAIANYAGIIRRIIYKTDRFLGDAGKAQTSAFPRGFAAIGLGLKRQAPLWTASAYMRCLLFALVYPLACILLIWGMTGHIGRLETTLEMSEVDGFVRFFSIFAQFSAIFFFWFYFKAKENRLIWLALAYFLCILSFNTGTIGLGIIYIFFFILLIRFIYFAIGGTINNFSISFESYKNTGNILVFVRFTMMLSLLIFSAFFIIATEILVFPLIGSVLFLINYMIASKNNRLGYFIIIFTFFVALTAFSIAYNTRDTATVSLAYFVGLLTMVNAPFDWMALGFTRLLLRVGLQRAGITPFVLAFVDLLLSFLIMAILALALLWLTQIFNHVTAPTAERSILHVDITLDALADPAQRGDVSLWWLYATLFSTQIPALLNLLVAGFCLMRGLPSMNRWMASQLPAEGPFNIWTCLSVSKVWAGQLALAMFIGLSAFYLLYFQGLVWIADGLFGTTLVDILRAAMLPIGQH